LPESALAAPIPGAAQGLQIRQVQAFSALAKQRQEEKLFLDVRSEMHQIENLADACPANLAQARQFRLMGNDSTMKQPFQAQGQSHEPGQARDASGSRLGATQACMASAWQAESPLSCWNRFHARVP
jgi:hypothetical protein